MLRTSRWIPATVDISEDSDISLSVDIRDMAIFGLIIPSTFNGTEIAFQVGYDNENWSELNDSSGTPVAMTVAASRAYDLPTALASWRVFQIVCGSSQTTEDTEFIVVAKG
jgi:hypothetical protein